MTFSGWPTPDVRGLGFGAVGHPPLMLRPLGPIEQPAPDGFTLLPSPTTRPRQPTSACSSPATRCPNSTPMRRVPSSARNSTARRARRHFIGLLDDEPVATGSGYVDEHHVHVEFIVDARDVPRPRLGYAITAAATLAAPDRPALLIASDLGQPVYRRLGYIAISRFTLWAGHRGGS